MTFSDELRRSISDLHLLDHPFYQEWNQGGLSTEILREYAKLYYRHVSAFPRYISATHSQCEDIEKRRVLLENLNDEEGLNTTDHPELWARFAEGLGVERKELKINSDKTAIEKVIDTFLSAGRSSYAEGLSALYAYEYQVPEVARTKIDGLKEHYGVDDEKSLEFFSVHEKADIYHREACEKLIDDFSDEEKTLALSSARKAAESLWNFLSEMMDRHHEYAA